MEDRVQVSLHRPADGNAPFAPDSLEHEIWSTPVLICLNAAAGTDVKGPPAGETTGTTMFNVS